MTCAASITRPPSHLTVRARTKRSYFCRLRRAEIGQQHHVSGKYLAAYAVVMAWREDRRRTPNGELYQAVTAAALYHPVSRMWAGYWQGR